MGFQTFLCLFLVLFSNIIYISNAYSFKAGGKDGWTLNPSESYDSWSKRQRFNINDTITFKYPKGTDSVLVVSKDDYNKCNINNPITKLEDGDSVFKLDRSGPFFFISGNKSNCDQGQKLSVVVISPRGQTKPTSPLASPPSPAMPTIAPAMPPAASAPTSPEIPTMPSPPMMSMPGSETPMAAPGPFGSPMAPPPMSFAVTFNPSIVAVALLPFVTSVGLSSFVNWH